MQTALVLRRLSGRQGLAPCEVGFGDRPVPCTRPMFPMGLLGIAPSSSKTRGLQPRRTTWWLPRPFGCLTSSWSACSAP